MTLDAVSRHATDAHKFVVVFVLSKLLDMLAGEAETACQVWKKAGTIDVIIPKICLFEDLDPNVLAERGFILQVIIKQLDFPFISEVCLLETPP